MRKANNVPPITSKKFGEMYYCEVKGTDFSQQITNVANSWEARGVCLLSYLSHMGKTVIDVED